MKPLFKIQQILPGLLLAALISTPAGAEELPNFTELVSQNSPAVVNISTTQEISRGSLPGTSRFPTCPRTARSGTSSSGFWKSFPSGSATPSRWARAS